MSYEDWRTFLIHQECIGSDYMLGISGQCLVTESFYITWVFLSFHRKTLSFFLNLDMEV